MPGRGRGVPRVGGRAPGVRRRGRDSPGDKCPPASGCQLRGVDCRCPPKPCLRHQTARPRLPPHCPSPPSPQENQDPRRPAGDAPAPSDEGQNSGDLHCPARDAVPGAAGRLGAPRPRAAGPREAAHRAAPYPRERRGVRVHGGLCSASREAVSMGSQAAHPPAAVPLALISRALGFP